MRTTDQGKVLRTVLYKWFPEKRSNWKMVRKNNTGHPETRVLVPTLSKNYCLADKHTHTHTPNPT